MITIKYNGKEYKDINDAFNQAIVDGIRNNISERVKPFDGEILKEGGKVSINIPKDFKDTKVVFEDMPDDLIARLTAALQ